MYLRAVCHRLLFDGWPLFNSSVRAVDSQACISEQYATGCCLMDGLCLTVVLEQ